MIGGSSTVGRVVGAKEYQTAAKKARPVKAGSHNHI